MTTLTAKRNGCIIPRLIQTFIRDYIPRKYKRTLMITSLICVLDKSNNISDATLRKIVKLFEIGSVREQNLRYVYYARRYFWRHLVNKSTIDYSGNSLHLPEMIDLYVNNNSAFNLTVTEQLIDTIYKRIPEYIKYGSEQLTKYDLMNILFFIKNKNHIPL